MARRSSTEITAIVGHDFRASPHVARYLCIGCDTLTRNLDADRLCVQCQSAVLEDTFDRAQKGEVVYQAGELSRLRK